MLRIAICDDEETFCAHMESMILEYGAKNSLELDVEVFILVQSCASLCKVSTNLI